MIHVLLVDDHTMIREMLAEILNQEEDIQVVGTAGAAADAIEKARERPPDIIVMDIDMPGLICFDAARRIQKSQPQVRFIFLSAYTHDHYIDQALKVGALAYLTKNEPKERILKAIREVAENRLFFSQDVQDRLIFEADSPRLVDALPRIKTLTSRETEVLGYLARGLAKKQVAAIMRLSVKTVEKHTDNLMQKLDIHDRVELARFAIREGLAGA